MNILNQFNNQLIYIENLAKGIDQYSDEKEKGILKEAFFLCKRMLKEISYLSLSGKQVPDICNAFRLHTDLTNQDMCYILDSVYRLLKIAKSIGFKDYISFIRAFIEEIQRSAYFESEKEFVLFYKSVERILPERSDYANEIKISDKVLKEYLYNNTRKIFNYIDDQLYQKKEFFPIRIEDQFNFFKYFKKIYSELEEGDNSKVNIYNTDINNFISNLLSSSSEKLKSLPSS